MNDKKIGALIYQLRTEKKLTQKQLAAALHVSDKAISKWERGSGCPDISLIPMIGKVFDVNIEYLLCGDLKENELDGGNMKRIKFYVCPTCGNISTMTGKGEFSCCGRKLEALTAQSMDAAHTVQVEEIEDDYFLTFEHEMTKEHHLSFVAYVMYDRVTLIRLYPEQDACVRLPKQSPGEIYFYCVNDGLYKIITPRKKR